jgi:hypothetical protein
VNPLSPEGLGRRESAENATASVNSLQELYTLDVQTGRVRLTERFQEDVLAAVLKLIVFAAHLHHYMRLSKSRRLPSIWCGEEDASMDFVRLTDFLKDPTGNLERLSAAVEGSVDPEERMSMLRGNIKGQQLLLRVLIQQEALRVMDLCLAAISERMRLGLI